MNKLIKSLERKIGNEEIISVLSILGCLNEDIFINNEEINRIRDFFNKFNPKLRNWKVDLSPDKKSIIFVKTHRGVSEKYELNSNDLNHQEVVEINKLFEKVKFFEKNLTLVFENEEKNIFSSINLVDLILERGKKGVQISRYKGLGEMNPEQLWETTLDPNSRSLVQVKVDQEIQAEETFSTLMGEVVEYRRNFIQENALRVSNLDI
tara:strand:- start:2340 stop:2963 length:624 start_codon:yes stop_codon:yes gene_type:complete